MRRNIHSVRPHNTEKRMRHAGRFGREGELRDEAARALRRRVVALLSEERAQQVERGRGAERVRVRSHDEVQRLLVDAQAERAHRLGHRERHAQCLVVLLESLGRWTAGRMTDGDVAHARGQQEVEVLRHRQQVVVEHTREGSLRGADVECAGACLEQIEVGHPVRIEAELDHSRDLALRLLQHPCWLDVDLHPSEHGLLLVGQVGHGSGARGVRVDHQVVRVHVGRHLARLHLEQQVARLLELVVVGVEPQHQIERVDVGRDPLQPHRLHGLARPVHVVVMNTPLDQHVTKRRLLHYARLSRAQEHVLAHVEARAADEVGLGQVGPVRREHRLFCLLHARQRALGLLRVAARRARVHERLERVTLRRDAVGDHRIEHRQRLLHPPLLAQAANELLVVLRRALVRLPERVDLQLRLAEVVHHGGAVERAHQRVVERLEVGLLLGRHRQLGWHGDHLARQRRAGDGPQVNFLRKVARIGERV
mmetsp:Transcript_11490/g.24804  ORF Transcript_11490/g.24804 Transcript_11490/m.24804 type:complete len:481 (+) Transcript_11490:489-1931(+)